MSSSTKFRVPFSHCPHSVRIPQPCKEQGAIPEGLSLDSARLCLFHRDKTGLNSEASEDSKEPGGQKESDGGTCPLQLSLFSSIPEETQT